MLRRSVSAFLITCLLGGFIGGVIPAQTAASGSIPPGPPYPDPVEGVHVYDQAGVLGPFAEGVVEKTIDEIEQGSGAQIVVYTQVKPESDTYQEAEYDAAALMEQWGVGRDGIDDGLVILFDLDPGLCHGQVQLYAGAGYAAAHLSGAERQALFEEDMVPPLQDCDFDAALLSAISRIAVAAGVSPRASATPSIVVPGTTATSMTAEDLFPTALRDGALTLTDREVYRTEPELIGWLVGEDADPEEIEAVRNIAKSAGRSLADMTIVTGWYELDDGTNLVNLAAFEIRGADTDRLQSSIHALALAMLDDPAYSEQEIAGKRLIVYDTAEAHDGYVNYLYAHDDIAWVFSTFEENAADVLGALPG